MISLFISSIASAYSVPYYNKDSKTNTFELKRTKVFEKIEFKASTWGTMHCLETDDIAEIKSSNRLVKVKSGQKVFMKTGCLSIQLKYI